MMRICSSCNVDSKYIKHSGDQHDYWSECTNCGTQNPKTVEIRQLDYDKITAGTDCVEDEEKWKLSIRSFGYAGNRLRGAEM